jgi:hypothetical protein
MTASLHFPTRLAIHLALTACSVTGAQGAVPAGASASPYKAWRNGPPQDPAFFPIAVWLQDPRQAAKYKQAGINTYVGLWKGPTEEQLKALRDAGLKVICEQNQVGLKHRDDPTIVAWMHGDEPDNAQELGQGKKGYGPPIAPAKIIEEYRAMQKADPTRPVLLNLGQGVAWDGWYGRGTRTNHPEDYIEYVKGGDIVSFDIYPVVHDKPEVQGKLWYVARGVERLVQWSQGRKVVWNCIECTRISSARKATPEQVKAEVWMSLIHGSRGLIYFVHEWKPRFNEHALLDDAPMLAAVTALNAQIHFLAPVLNSPTVADGGQVTSSAPEVPVAAIIKKHGGASYLFAVAMRGAETKATFALRGLPSTARAEVLGENRGVVVTGGRFADSFGPYGVHLYRIQ